MKSSTPTTRPSAVRLLRGVLRSLPDGAPDYDMVTQAVLNEIPESEYKTYLYEFIKLSVSTQISEQRNNTLSRLKNLKPPRPQPSESEPQTFIDIAPTEPPRLVRRGPTKRDFILSAAEKALKSRVFVPEFGFQFIGDLTEEFARAVAEDRVKRAGQMSDSAGMYESFADLIQSEGVTTLADIPDKFATLVNPDLI